MEKTPHGPLTNYTDLLLDAICLVDADGRFVYASAACERIFGYDQEEIVGRTVAEMVHPDDRERTMQAAREVRTGDSKTYFENRYIRKDGSTVHIMWSARWSEADQLRIAVARDITDRKHAESMQHALYAISEAANVADDLQILFERVDGIVKALVPACSFSVALKDDAGDAPMFSYCRGVSVDPPGPDQPAAPLLSAEIIQSGEAVLVCRVSDNAGDHRSWRDVSESAVSYLGVPLKSRTATLGALLLQSPAGTVPYAEKDRELLEFVATQLVAAMERVQMQARLRHMALYDNLTGLPNRQLFYDRLATALNRARREQRILAVLFIDLDRLKQVNDAFGHATGDDLLRVAADRLVQNLRATDTVSRLGGDEFAVLLEGFNTAEYAYEIAGKIEAILTQPVELPERMLKSGACVGVALFPVHGSDERELLIHADNEMYAAKRQRPQRT